MEEGPLVSRQFRPYLSRFIIVVALGSLIVTGAALAKSKSKISLHGPKTVKLQVTYSVRASGRASGKAGQLVGFEGMGITCKSKYTAETKAYPANFMAVTFFVHGKFSKAWHFTSSAVGTARLCAYLIPIGGQHTYAHKQVKWTITP